MMVEGATITYRKIKNIFKPKVVAAFYRLRWVQNVLHFNCNIFPKIGAVT